MKKKRKLKLKQKWIGLMVCVLCFVATIAYVVADATSTLTIQVVDPVIAATNGNPAIIDRSESDNKKTVTYHLDFKNDKMFTSMSFRINYDPTKLKFVSTEKSVKDQSPSENIFNEEEGEIVWSIMYSGAGVDTDLDIGSVTFEVLETASGLTEVSLSEVSVDQILNGGANLVPVDVNAINEEVFIRVPVKESSISLATPSLEIDLGSNNKTSNIVVNYAPLDTTDSKEFTYEVTEGSDSVTVENGVVTGFKVGNAKIKVTAFGKEFEVAVSVKEHLNGVEINKTNDTMEIDRNTVNGPIVLTTHTTPNVTSDTITYTWTSSNPSVATVSNGSVTILNKGQTTITVSATSTETGNVFTDTIILNVSAPATSVDITDTDFTLNKTGNNTTKTLNLVVNPSDTTDEIKWTSSDTSIATVDQNGKVVAIGKGTAIITATAGNHSDTVSVTVNVPVTDITLDVADITLLPTQTRKVTANVIPADATDKTVSWSVNDTSVASVDNNGTVTAKNAGTTTLTVQSGSITKTVTIKVLMSVNDLTMNIPSGTLTVGETLDLIASTTTNAEETGKITWTSSNPSAAVVDQNGKVTAIAPNDGSASTTVITATWTSDMDATHTETAQSTITVVDPIKEIRFNKNKMELSGKGVTENLTVTITPNPTSSDKTITWTSSDPSVAVVTNGVVTTVGKGTAVIKATTSNGLTASCEVVVTVPTTKVTISGSKELTMNINTTKNLTAVVEPNDTSETLTWSSSDDNIVSVNNSGVITAKNAGTATITAKSGSKEDQVVIHVVIPVTSFDLVSLSDIKVIKGFTSTIVTKVTPENATDQAITWTSSNENIAVVDEFGVVTGKNAGTAVITGTLSNGMKVNVNVEVEIIPITDMKIDETEIELNRKDTKQIELIIEPENTTERDQIIWTSSDEDVAVVDEFGVVTALGEGTATITAVYKDIEVSTEVSVTEIHLESISIENMKTEMDVEEKVQLNVMLNPSDVTDDLIYTYKSSDENIATIDENGMITGVNPGTVTFTVDVNGMEITHEMTVKKVVNPQTGIASVAGYAILSLTSVLAIGYLIRKKAHLK